MLEWRRLALGTLILLRQGSASAEVAGAAQQGSAHIPGRHEAYLRGWQASRREVFKQRCRAWCPYRKCWHELQVIQRFVQPM
mgnify:CR=1 FL=1